MTTSQTSRILSIDALRGVVIVLMALDHVRDYFHASPVSPLEMSETNPVLFLTRWVTHFCAPVFVFLAGVSAGLMENAGRSKSELRGFLISRGLVLILLEFTVIAFAWQMNLTWWRPIVLMQVIWVLGVGMVLMGGAIYLPRKWLIVGAVITLLGHNLLPGATPFMKSVIGDFWHVLYAPSMIEAGGFRFLSLYTILPWFAVMAAGYLAAGLYQLEQGARIKLLLRVGAAGIAGFAILRLVNVYGDPAPWAMQDSWMMTVASFLNTSKYPPSLLFVLMTLSPALILLALFERAPGVVMEKFARLGQASMFFYIAHAYLIHGLAIIVGVVTGFEIALLFKAFYTGYPSHFGFGLWGVYIVWLGVVAALYPISLRYAAAKQRRAHPIMRYI